MRLLFYILFLLTANVSQADDTCTASNVPGSYNVFSVFSNLSTDETTSIFTETVNSLQMSKRLGDRTIGTLASGTTAADIGLSRPFGQYSSTFDKHEAKPISYVDTTKLFPGTDPQVIPAGQEVLMVPGTDPTKVSCRLVRKSSNNNQEVSFRPETDGPRANPMLMGGNSRIFINPQSRPDGRPVTKSFVEFQLEQPTPKGYILSCYKFFDYPKMPTPYNLEAFHEGVKTAALKALVDFKIDDLPNKVRESILHKPCPYGENGFAPIDQGCADCEAKLASE